MQSEFRKDFGLCVKFSVEIQAISVKLAIKMHRKHLTGSVGRCDNKLIFNATFD